MVITMEKVEAQIIKKMNERIIKNFLDVIIMSELRNGALSGYDIISFVSDIIAGYTNRCAVISYYFINIRI